MGVREKELAGSTWHWNEYWPIALCPIDLHSGGFQQVGDLVNVSGIGEKRLRRLEPFVKVVGIVGDTEKKLI